MHKSLFDIDKKILSALKLNKPIVALESTLISHGLPFPENVKVAQSSIDAVEESGSIAATIAIINGKIKVGLNKDEINILAKSKNVEKVSRHNLAIALNNKVHAATTVASTMYIASTLGIKFFATGGIGGVHLNAKNTFDISADLTELSNTNMYVICSGAKSILDLDKTFEKLETLGVSRIGVNTNYMPGFYYYQTNKKVDFNFLKINKLNDYLKTREKINQKGSVLLLNPVPKKRAIEKKLIEKWIKSSVLKANTNSIQGKDLTPYLLAEIAKLSNNKTLETNMHLIINNAKTAGMIASDYYAN
tara:strand:+ start:472 stop:1386 length:915 start_codon:yes stop_codon:yes gene_type:complete